MADQSIDYRQIQGPASLIGPKDIPDNGAATAAESLASAFKDFGDKAFDVGSQIRTTQGKQDGAASDGTPKTGLSALTIYGQNYNAAAHVTYLTNTQNDVDRQMNQAEIDNQGDPAGFQTTADAIKSATVKAAPIQYAPEIGQLIDSRTVAGMNRVSQQNAADTKSDALAAYTASVDGRIANTLQTVASLPNDDHARQVTQDLFDDNKNKLDALVTSHAITAEHAALSEKKFEENYDRQNQGQVIHTYAEKLMTLARGNVETGDAALQQIHDDPNLSDDQKELIVQQYHKDRDQLGFERSRQNASQLADIAGRLAGGESGPQIEQDIHDQYKQGALSPEEFAAKISDSVKNQADDIKDRAEMALVGEALHGGHGLDPQEPKQVHAVGKTFDTMTSKEGVAPGTDRYTQAAIWFTSRTNIVPDSVKSYLRIGLLSGDPTQMAAAAAMGQRLGEANPQADPYENNPKLHTLTSLIQDNLKAGLDPVQATQLAQTNTNRNSEDLKRLEEAYSKGKYATDNPTQLHSLLKGTKATQDIPWYQSNPSEPVAMQSEFESLTRQYFQMTNGDINKSRQLAADVVTQRWGTTNVNGPTELVKYPIERTYNIPPQIVRADVASSVKAAGFTGDPSEVHLVPTAQTDRTRGQQWGLVHIDPKTGAMDTINDDKNRPVTYQIPLGQNFNETRQHLIDAQMADAKRQRDVERSVATDQIAAEKQASDYYLTPQGRSQQFRDR